MFLKIAPGHCGRRVEAMMGILKILSGQTLDTCDFVTSEMEYPWKGAAEHLSLVYNDDDYLRGELLD